MKKTNWQMKLGLLALIAVLAAVMILPGNTAWASEKKKFKKFHTIVDAEFVKKMVELKEIGLLVDSRPKKGKFDKGYIPGAISLPDSKFEKMKQLLPADKNALLVFYCQGLKCPLSHKSAFKAEALGYTNVKVYAKGYPDFVKHYGPGALDAAAAKAAGPGQVLVIDGAKAQKVLELIKKEGLTAAASKPKGKGMFNAREGAADFTTFEKLFHEKPESFLIVDSRDAHEFETGHFNGAQRMNVNELEKQIKEWKPGKPVLFVCGTGARSGEAYYMIQDQRPDLKDQVFFLDGEITWKKDGSYTYKPPK